MTQVTRQPNEMMEDQIWEEWQDGNDSALYDTGYEDGVNYAISVITNVLDQGNVDNVPASWLLKLIRHTLQERE